MITVRVNVSKDLARLRAAAGPDARKVERDFMIKHGRALVSSSGATPGLVQITAPFSRGVRGAAARKAGEGAVETDIRRVLFPVDHSSSALAAMIPDIHRDARSRSTGRVRRNNRKPKPAPAAALKKYIKLKQKLVGLLAAAVVGSAEAKLGSLKGVPAWVRRHTSKGGGSCLLTENAGGITVSVQNTSPRIQADLQRKWDYATGYRLNAMRRDIPFAAKALEKKLQLALSGPA